jgi:ATP-dependent RNA helicase DDX23/PRP28
MTERDWRIFREDNEIYLKGGRVTNPIREWSDGGILNNILLQNLKEMQYTKPRPIQMQAITIGLEKRDLIAIAPTGEGKTLAYLIPIINFMLPL